MPLFYAKHILAPVFARTIYKFFVILNLFSGRKTGIGFEK